MYEKNKSMNLTQRRKDAKKGTNVISANPSFASSSLRLCAFA
jgi:hypothetical protein